MKNIKIISIVLLIFFTFMFYRGIKNNQIRKLTKSKTELETLYKVAQDQKQVYIDSNKVLKSDLTRFEGQKTALEQKLKDYTKETGLLIEAYKRRISEANLLQPDTLYLDLFSKWPTFNGPLKYRFAENQVREIYLNVLERGHYENLYIRTSKGLVICTDLNKQNDLIIGNLSGQNTNLQKQVDLSELQLVNLQDELKLTDKTLNKQKRKTFFYKVTTIAVGTGLLIFAIK